MSELPQFPGGVQVAPSILSADFARLGEQVDEVIAAGAKVIHVDVMDGQFVPPITIGPLIASSIADRVHEAGAVLDVHMMISSPESQIEAFAKAGADCITIHHEADHHAYRTLAAIREAGAMAGLAINPGTQAEVLAPLVSICDLVLCMSVNPGWGGQKFIESSPAKLRAIAEIAAEAGSSATIEVDGGVDASTAPAVVEAGARLLVAGSAVFGDSDPGAAFQRIAAAAESGSDS